MTGDGHGGTSRARNGIMLRISWAFIKKILFFSGNVRACFCGFTVIVI